ncbi:MXAN_2561 family MXYO-CTERM-anchored protein [Hyalangium rubrum]|uniref:MXAN_2561 family MXYO-CTERM-anchored protein n=1 Tax=Hyalangium rubrum TaxID=3103134 RepID=A0ABU5GXT7_9BACT|nr:MXAN_2561 family MXYO-CTERM-anchored protein [Hyalangium sp. s54d21]MDY7225357.1 MXAN_2561 family MXYO-CTERM-anchored protein [Hyalangium sp. s54d21]
MRYLLIALTLAASSAFGQTVVLTTSNNTDSLRVPKEPCNLTRTVNWAFNGDASAVCEPLRFWLVAGTSCSDEPSGTFYELTNYRVPANELLTRRTGSVTFEVSNLPDLSCPAADTEKEYRLCASVEISSGLSGCNNSFQKDDLSLVYDAKPPSAPSIGTVASLDQALSVRVNAPSDANRLKLTISRQDGSGSRSVTQSVDQSLFRMENLENGVTYRLTARALDEADNESVDSESKEGTPILTRGFMDRYVEANGQEMGGCGAAGAGVAGGWVLAALGFWLSSRRNRS